MATDTTITSGEVKDLILELAKRERAAKDYQDKLSTNNNRIQRIIEALNDKLGTWTGTSKVVQVGSRHYLLSRSQFGKVTIAPVPIIHLTSG